MSAPGGKLSHRTSRLLCLAVSVMALGVVLQRIDLAALGNVLLALKLEWFLGAILLFGLALLMAAWRWHLVLRLTGNTVHLGATTRAVFIGHFFNTLLLGPAGGDIAKSALYSRWYGHPMTEVLAGSYLDRLLGLSGLILFGALAFVLALVSDAFSQFGELRLNWSPAWVAFGLAGALVFVAGALVFRRYFPKSGLTRMVESFVSGGLRLIRSPRYALPGELLGFLVQAACGAVLGLCLQAVSHQPLAWDRLLWTLPLISIIGSLPITIGGLGLRENAAFYLLGLYGVPGTDAVAASLLTLTGHAFWALAGAVLWWWEVRAWQGTPERAAPRTLSAVIPALNEADELEPTVRLAQQVPEICEVIVVDGGSTDGTPDLARRLGCRVLASPPGRGAQLRLGAAQAAGDVILLLHSDTWLPPDAGKAACNALRDRTVVGGGFWKVFRAGRWPLRGSRFRCAARYYLGGWIMGDQTLFLRREVLEWIDGVPDLPLMEEFELCRRLRRVGRLALAGATVRTSDRRFARLGVWRTYWRMTVVLVRFWLGTPPQKLREIYERDRS